MASKPLLSQLRTLTHCRLTNPNYTSAFKLESLTQSRRFSDAPQPPSIEFKPPPPPVNSDAQVKKFSSSLNQAELAKFSAIGDTWWDAEGPFKPLHNLNPTRLAFIRSSLCRHFGKDPYSVKPFEGLKFVDVGCGGGILSEPLAQMGASVTGIDAVEKNIKIARLHADLDPITSSIEYLCTTAEKLAEEQRKFDAVLALEVIEHVADPAEFCKSLLVLTVSNGTTVISTINRSMRVYATAIVVAEYLLNWLPKGTRVVKVSYSRRTSFNSPTGFHRCREWLALCIIPTGKWSLSDDIGVNFIAYGTKNCD